MNLKRFQPYIWEIVLIAVISFTIFAIPMPFYGWKGFTSHAVEVFAIASGLEGSGELKRRGRWKIRRNFFVFIIFLFISSLILLRTHTTREVYPQIGFYLGFASLAAIFPVAYYTGRDQQKSTSQQTSANVS
jgi:hypothetical protein